jgi:fido (protein-threonine AMPylation protein)/5S rRNA maturation endonuclease (ribonuclease M5)
MAKGEAIKKGKIVILEGNMDVISSVALGLKNVIGLNGCALSPTHIDLIKKLGCDVVLALDNDVAGHSATIKSAEMLESNGISVTCIDIDDFGNYKDNGDILQASITNPELKKDFEKKYMSIEKTVFEYRLKYDYFFNKTVNSTSIKEVYSKIEHNIDSEKLVLFKKFCSDHSGYSQENIQDIIDSRNMEDNLYAQLGLQIINPFLEDKGLTNDQRDIVVASILKNLDKNLIKKNNSIILNVDNINRMIYKVKQKSIESDKTKALKTELEVREKQPNVFSIEGICGIHKKMYGHASQFAGELRKNEARGCCHPEQIRSGFESLCASISKRNISAMNDSQKLQALSIDFYKILSLHMFDGPTGRIERYFIEQTAKGMGLQLDFSKLTGQIYQKVIISSFKANTPKPIYDMLYKISSPIEKSNNFNNPNKENNKILDRER